MNLRAIANTVTRAINPNIAATIQTSIGATSAADGARTPTFSTQSAIAQVQPLSGGDLRQLDGINLSGTHCSITLTGVLNSTVRVSAKGGDLVTLADGPSAGVWLVIQVTEQWPDWVRVAATLQNGA